MTFKVLGLCGSLRQKSYNLIALKTAGELMPAGLALEIARYDDLPMYNFDVQEIGRAHV